MKERVSISFINLSKADYLRIRLASIVELEVDKMGRVQIPTAILAKYHIGKDVVVLGSGDHIEVWDEKSYEEYSLSIEDSYEEIAERLGNKDE